MQYGQNTPKLALLLAIRPEIFISVFEPYIR